MVLHSHNEDAELCRRGLGGGGVYSAVVVYSMTMRSKHGSNDIPLRILTSQSVHIILANVE
jgi:hypothetical protein